MAALHSGASELGSAPPPVVADRVSALRLRTFGSAAPSPAWRRPLEGPFDGSRRFEHAAAALTAGDVALGRKLADEYAALGDSDEPLDVIQRLILSAWSAKLASETRRAQHDIGEAVRSPSRISWSTSSSGQDQSGGLSPNLSTRAGTQGCGAPTLTRSTVTCAWTGVPRALNGRELELLDLSASRMSNADLATLLCLCQHH